MKLRNYTRDIENGDPILTGSTQIVGPDGNPIATVGVNGVSGAWEYTANGLPGATSAVFSGSGQTRKIAGDTSIQQGDLFTAEIPEALRLFTDGVYGESGMPLSAPGGMTVRVGIGGGIVLGRYLGIYAAQDLTVGAAHATLARIDSVIMRLTRTGTFAGRLQLALLAGTPAASPVPRTLTLTDDVWEVKIGEVEVAAAAGAITGGTLSLTGRRYAGVPGRVLMGVRSFAGVSAVDLDEVFTPAYRDYEILINVDTLTPTNPLLVLMRTNRANVNAAVYDWVYTSRNQANVGVGEALKNATNFRVTPDASQQAPGCDIAALLTLFDPMLPRPKRMLSQVTLATTATTMESGVGGCMVAATGGQDGLRLSAAGGSLMTGSVRIWAKG